MTHTLSSGHVSLRAPEPSDLDFLYCLENQPDSFTTGWTNAPVSRQMLWDYLQAYSADIYSTRQLRLIICADTTAVGVVDLAEYDPANERAFVGIAILPQYQGNGYAKEALNLLMDYASTTLGMHQLCAIVAVDNEASRGLFLDAGFRSAGKLRSWLRRGRQYTDALLLQKLF